MIVSDRSSDRMTRMTAVNPGVIDTQITCDVVAGDESADGEIAKQVPIGRAGSPEVIASAVLWLCSPAASYVVVHALTVDGGIANDVRADPALMAVC